MSKDNYATIAEAVAPHHVGNRTLSAALLAWFLINVWRLDPEDVEDAICDGGGDKGIDALVVDDDLAEIAILQSKYHDNPTRTQGDKDLKALVGAADYFASPETVDGLLASSPNPELRKLVERTGVREKIAQGKHTVRLAFVTNSDLDDSGTSYVAARKSLEPSLGVWDRKKLVEVVERTRRPDLRTGKVELVAKAPPTEARLTPTERIAVALIPARQLVRLPGIDDFTLFNRNVRLFAGRTRINGELKKTVQNPDEHRLFPAYHNGLTLLTQNISIHDCTLKLEGVGVVNGCQSLLTLYGSRESITDELCLLVKIVEVPAHSDVADKITYRTNNQNAVNLRDQRSSDPVMIDLQRSVRQTYGKAFALRIRAGEHINADRVLDNGTAAQLIMACYLAEPWSAVRKVRLFDQDFRRIFNHNITPDKLYFLDIINNVVTDVRGRLRSELKASFSSIRFTLAYLITKVLELSPSGKHVLDEPRRWLPEQLDQTVVALETIAVDVVDSVNFYVKEEAVEREDFDPKVEFKSRTGVAKLEHEVLKQSRRQAQRDDTYLFSVTPAARAK